MLYPSGCMENGRRRLAVAFGTGDRMKRRQCLPFPRAAPWAGLPDVPGQIADAEGLAVDPARLQAVNDRVQGIGRAVGA